MISVLRFLTLWVVSIAVAYLGYKFGRFQFFGSMFLGGLIGIFFFLLLTEDIEE